MDSCPSTRKKTRADPCRATSLETVSYYPVNEGGGKGLYTLANIPCARVSFSRARGGLRPGLLFSDQDELTRCTDENLSVIERSKTWTCAND